MASASLIPAGHNFLNPRVLLSVAAEKLHEDLCEQADKRNPDALGMYIYNDFFPYAILDLIDKTISGLKAKVTKKDWDAAMPILEALTVFMEDEGQWTMCDDGERVEMTNKVYGALLVNILRGLKKEDRLDASHFPCLESLLRGAAEWGDSMRSQGCDSDYDRVCKAIGYRLFGDRTEADIALEKARVEEWISSMSADWQENIRARMADEYGEEPEGDWFKGGKRMDEDQKDDDFVLSRVWKEYKEYLSSVPTKPLRGPPNWDLSKWSAAQKKQFSFDEMGDSEDEFGF